MPASGLWETTPKVMVARSGTALTLPSADTVKTLSEFFPEALSLIFWPLSITWDPFNGSGGAKDLNYEATMTNVKKKKKSDTKTLDEKLDAKQISESDYRRKIKEIDEDYSFE